MGKQSIWAISNALEDGGVRAEIREDGQAFMVFTNKEGHTIESSMSNDTAIDMALATLDGELSEMPSETELKSAFRVLRGKAALKTGRIPCEGIENTSPIVNAILAHMEPQPEWHGKTETLLRELSLKDGSPLWKHLSTRVFAYRINESRNVFRFFDLFIETFRRNDGSYVRMHWLGQSDASDASDARDAREHSDEDREALAAMTTLRTQDNDLEKH